MACTVSTVRPLITKLQNYSPLSHNEEQVLEAAVSGHRETETGADIVVEGTSPDSSTLLLSGFAGRYNMTREGRLRYDSSVSIMLLTCSFSACRWPSIISTSFLNWQQVLGICRFSSSDS